MFWYAHQTMCVRWGSSVSSKFTVSNGVRQGGILSPFLFNIYIMGKAHKNCIIGHKFCLHHITGTAFIIRLKLNVYIVENSDTFQKIYSFMQFK